MCPIGNFCLYLSLLAITMKLQRGTLHHDDVPQSVPADSSSLPGENSFDIHSGAMLVSDITIRANVVFFGLPAVVAGGLQRVLSNLDGQLQVMPMATADECLETAEGRGVDVVFCNPNTNLVRALRSEYTKAVIIAASRLPSTDEWLETLEAGADDYCAAPFETDLIQWMLESNLAPQRLAA